MFDSIISSSESTLSVSESLISIGVALILGFIIALCYMHTQKKGTFSKDFVISVTILPAVISIVIILVGSNVARAFSLAGAFALVRFRTQPGSAKDITVVFFSMAIGLASGLGFIVFAGAATAIILIVLIALSLSKFGEDRREEKLLKITIPESLNYKDVFTDLFDANLADYEVRNVRTTNMGSMYELQYAVVMKKDIDEKAFIDGLRCRNGNLNISLGMMPDKTGTTL